MSKKSLQQIMPPALETGVELLSGQRQKNESDTAVIACNDWLRMGSGRSVRLLLDNYLQQSTFQRGFMPPSDSYHTLRTWSSDFNWPQRATEFDATWEARKNVEMQAVLNYGLALSHERVRKLYKLAALLEAQIYEQGLDGVFYNLWMPDVKSIGSGEFAERVDIERFNSPLLEQYRKVLEDIAKETGGRINRTDVTTGDKPFSLEIKAVEYRNLIPSPLEERSIPDSDPSGESESAGDGAALG